MSVNINTASATRNKKKFEKFINYTGGRDKQKDREINKININTDITNSSEKKKYQYEYSNRKDDKIDLNLIKNDEEEKNILFNLIKEGLLSLDELSEIDLKDDKKYDIHNLQFKDINMEKILKKILLLNKSLKDTKLEIKKLENEENTFSDAINESRQNTISQNNKDIKDIKDFKEKENNNNKYYNGKSNDILKKYEEDLKFLNQLINENDNNFDEIK